MKKYSLNLERLLADKGGKAIADLFKSLKSSVLMSDGPVPNETIPIVVNDNVRNKLIKGGVPDDVFDEIDFHYEGVIVVAFLY